MEGATRGLTRITVAEKASFAFSALYKTVLSPAGHVGQWKPTFKDALRWPKVSEGAAGEVTDPAGETTPLKAAEPG